LRAVGPQGAGHRKAAEAWQQLVQADSAQLPQILSALDQANPLAANWIRTAVDAIAERHLQRGTALPEAQLARFVEDLRHDGRARRLAFEWLVRVDPSARGRLLGPRGSKMLNDPSLELRREALLCLIEEAQKLQKQDRANEATALYWQGLTAARDPDQIRLLADRLRKLGQTVDLPRQFGFIVRWRLIGPFDNRGGKGLDAVYGPEKELDFAAEYPGKHGTVKWIHHVTTDQMGTVDLNRALGEEKGVVAYAAAEFYSDKPQEVDIRLGSYNAIKLWLNGTLLARHPVYHSGAELDQHVRRGVLRPGRNIILLKVCQNEQTQEWARYWSFQLRVCDALGGAILSADRDRPADQAATRPQTAPAAKTPITTSNR